MPEAKSYLAVDLGAESGRVVQGTLASGTLNIQEIHRFANEPVRYGNSLHWDAPRLWLEIQRGISQAPDRNLHGIGVDCWGVDFALLDQAGELIGNPFHYRDSRTAGMMEYAFELVPAAQIYAATGIQMMPINSIYQLLAMQETSPGLLASADRLLTMPDLFHYWMTGNAVCEYTNATTTQMVDPRTRSWARGLIEQLGLETRVLQPIVEPGTHVGALRSGICAKSGIPVIAPATHDTASAVASISASNNTAFLSSGTWSLLGAEVNHPVITPESQRLNFTNEGGVGGTTRLLKNVMGLWLLQCCKRAFEADGDQYTYANLIELAAREQAFTHLIDPDDSSFLHPEDIRTAIRQFCGKTDQPVPHSPGAYVRTVLESLALKYRLVLRSLESLTGKRMERIRIVGGGCRNELLNQFTADATGRRVFAGPVEATALGNVVVQMLATGAVASLEEGRELVDRCFAAEIYEPYDTPKWDKHAERFEQYCGWKTCLN